MNDARTKVYVFDFDGTLVDSATAKRQCFFEVFPHGLHHLVESVLEEDPDGSRHLVIPKMLHMAQAQGFDILPNDASYWVDAYAQMVQAAVAQVPSVTGATEVLSRAAAAGPVYVFSMTPHDELVRAVEARPWACHLTGVFGHPKPKIEVLEDLINCHDVSPQEILVVGDGKSDRDAAVAAGCRFHLVSTASPLTTLAGQGVVF